jgi:site-specific DNA recombinase
MEIALYLRVSTSRQQQAQTIEQQLDRLRAHVAQHPDWHLAEEHIYRDDGYTGAKLNRPGLDRLRDRAAFAAFELLLITAPDRLARNYVHQMLLIDELAQRGCQVEFLDRPMSNDPHDQLLLQIRGAVAEYERNLIADRMRRGRQAKLRSGQLLPWTRAPYGYILDVERPRDPSRVRLDPVKAAIVQQIFAWYTDPQTPTSLYMVAKRLSDDHIPTPTGSPRWNVASIRGILRSSAYTGLAYSGRTHPAPARRRKSALQPVGPGESHQPAPAEEWIAIAVPAIVSQETFDLAQARLDQNKQLARRNNTAHDYLLRGLVSCGACKLSCMGRSLHPGYDYYVCRGRSDALRAATHERCTARYAPASALDELVWQDLCQVLTTPTLITHELERAHRGEWLPQALQARRKTLRDALAQIERQQARLLDAYLAEIISADEFERKRQEVQQTHNGLAQQLRQVEAQAQHQIDVAKLAEGISAFCQRIGPTLEHLDFAQRRQLVELLIDCVIVTDGQVEIRYVLPTGPAGESTAFCHLRKDYFNLPSARVGQHNRPSLCQRVNRVGRQQIPGLASFAQPYDNQPQRLRLVDQCHWHDHHASLEQLLGSRVAQIAIALRAFAASNRRGFALLTPVVQQLVAFLPAHHEAYFCLQRCLYPLTAGIAAVPDVAYTSAPGRARAVEQCLLDCTLRGGVLAARRPPVQVRQGRRSIHPDHKQPLPVQTRHQDGRPFVRQGHRLATTREAAGFGRAHHAPVGIGQAFWLFPDTAVPEQQHFLASSFKRLHALIGLLPEEGADVVGRPIRRVDQITDPLGARRCLSRREQIATQFSEQQAKRTMAMGENDLHQIDSSLDQADVELCRQALSDRVQKLDQVRAQQVCHTG